MGVKEILAACQRLNLLSHESRSTSAAASSVAHHRDRNSASTRLDVALEVENLLPRAQHELAVFDRNGKGRAKQCCLQV